MAKNISRRTFVAGAALAAAGPGTGLGPLQALARAPAGPGAGLAAAPAAVATVTAIVAMLQRDDEFGALANTEAARSAASVLEEQAEFLDDADPSTDHSGLTILAAAMPGGPENWYLVSGSITNFYPLDDEKQFLPDDAPVLASWPATPNPNEYRNTMELLQPTHPDFLCLADAYSDEYTCWYWFQRRASVAA